MHQFIGISLGGGKADRTCLAVVEYYPEHEKIFLSKLVEKITNKDDEHSADQILYDLVAGHKKRLEVLAIDAPLKLPKCMRCRLTCPGYEKCDEPEITWMWEHYHSRKKKKRPKRLFTPYTERCAELYVSTELEEPFHPSHALGANAAPLAARAHFLLRRLKIPAIQVFPKVSLWRIGRALNIQKSYLRFHKHSVDGDQARQTILKQLVERDIAFLYEQDTRTMVENNQAFEAFLCALTAVLKFKGQVEARPKGFPKAEGWIEIPKKEIVW